MTTTPQRKRLVIADDHRLVAECVSTQVAATHDVVAIVHALADVMPAIARTAPDALLLDLSFGRESSLPMIPAIRSEYPTVFVIVLTMHAEPALVAACLAAGAHRYVTKTQESADLLTALVAMDSTPTAAVRGSLASQSDETVLKRVRSRQSVGTIVLTERQFDILRRLSVGATRSAVAAELGISAKGVDYNLSQVRRLLGVRRLINVVSWFRDATTADYGPGEAPNRMSLPPSLPAASVSTATNARGG